MAGTVQVPQVIVDTGVVPTDQHAVLAATNEIPGNSRCIIHIKTNATAGGITVTLRGQGTIDAAAMPNRVINVAASSEVMIAGIPPSVYELGDNNIEFDVNTPANVSFFGLYQVS